MDSRKAFLFLGLFILVLCLLLECAQSRTLAKQAREVEPAAAAPSVASPQKKPKYKLKTKVFNVPNFPSIPSTNVPKQKPKKKVPIPSTNVPKQKPRKKVPDVPVVPSVPTNVPKQKRMKKVPDVPGVPSVPITNVPSVPITNVPSVPFTNVPCVPITNVPSVPITNVPCVPITNVPSVPITNVPNVPENQNSSDWGKVLKALEVITGVVTTTIVSVLVYHFKEELRRCFNL